MVFDGEAEQVPGMEAGVLVHVLEELWVLVGVFDVHEIACLSHQPCYPLPHLNTNGLLGNKAYKFFYPSISLCKVPE